MDAPFDAISNADAFEQLVFDILQAEGFSDIVWRGPGPDGGRDIEAVWATSDPTGGVFRTTWYVECKWYAESVGFSDIEPKLLAATVRRADYLLIATSARIKNTALDAAQEWLGARGFPFRIRIWTGRDLLRLAVKHPGVFRRHFPGLMAPAWGALSSELTRVQLLAGSSVDRLSWRIAPTLQWIANSIGPESSPEALAAGLAELELVSYMLRAHEVFSSVPPAPPVRRLEDVREAVEFAVECCARRHLMVSTTLESSTGNVSRALLICIMFELLMNAAIYSENGPPTVTLKGNGASWEMQIRNASSEGVLPDWPIIGYRGRIARERLISGQGLGCWFVAALAPLAGVRVAWQNDANTFLATVTGASG